jgi:energy-coupling factor transporter transmembrane protein EcfT
MTFSLVIFLYLYFVFLLIWAIFSLIGFYHLLRFGGRMFGSFFLGVFYLAGSIALLYLSYILLGQVEWGVEVEMFSGFNNVKDIFSSPTILK